MFELHPELAQLEKNIVETRLLVSRQRARVERMAEMGQDTTKAKAVLLGLGEVLDYFYAERELLLEAVEQTVRTSQNASTAR